VFGLSGIGTQAPFQAGAAPRTIDEASTILESGAAPADAEPATTRFGFAVGPLPGGPLAQLRLRF